MKCLIVFVAAVAAAHAQLLHVAPLAHYAPAPVPLRTQYHAQDELGQYSFGYSGGPSSKVESSAGGVTQGAFSYVDAHGLVQSRSYVADPVHGFRVAGTDIPVDANTPIVAAPAHPLAILARKRRQVLYSAIAPLAHPVAYAAVYPSHLPADTPEVHAAKIAHYNQYNYESLRNAHLAGRKKRSVYAYAAPLALATPSVYHAAPAVYHAAPTVYHAAAPTVYSAVAPAPAVYHAAPVAAPAVSSQYHSQDELGQYSYGYSNPTSSKTETRHANGVTQGAYSYVDAHGLVQSASYVADPHNGFRVAATNLPVA
ncbi:uncharacterized protein LOC128986689 [Macrosteles quadrilineatus]|uniref:uncharacterized protein LOC128986689 n=1 Tax=Macrosteles quadrilineatus TaxID=74068 RepID=UPI0023E271F5|nr:uncharacterized protein LOC128986689 [Macrosteles quadrilineatus]